MSDEDPTQLMRDLRGMTGTNHVGRTAHLAVTEIERLRQRVARLEGYAEGRDRMIAAARDALAIRKDAEVEP